MYFFQAVLSLVFNTLLCEILLKNKVLKVYPNKTFFLWLLYLQHGYLFLVIISITKQLF